MPNDTPSPIGAGTPSRRSRVALAAAATLLACEAVLRSWFPEIGRLRSLVVNTDDDRGFVLRTGGEVTFEVSDTGVGMSQMALARLGERFTGLHKSGVRGTSGAGLGLSLAFGLAKLHGGALDLSSAPGEGTIARLRLPVVKSLAEMAGAAVALRGDIQSQLDRVAQFRRERGGNGRDAA